MAAKKGSRSKGEGSEKGGKQSSKKGPIAAQREAASRSIEQRIARGLAHPLRVRILTVLNDRVASPNELRKELGEGLSQVSYHIKVLNDFELIEMVSTEPRRGAVEHFYRAASKVFIPAWMVKAWPKSARRGVASTILEEVEEDIIQSIKADLFDDRPDCVVARDPRILDSQGREDAEEAAAEFFMRFLEISKESDKRLRKGEGDGKTVQTSAVVLVFTSAAGKNLKVKRDR